MFRILLTFAVICIVFCQDCSQFNIYKNNNEILNVLSGTFYIVSTSSNITINCEKITYYETGLQLYNIVQSPGGCCRKSNTTTITTDLVTGTVTSLNTNTGCLNKFGSFENKYIYTTGTGDNLCVVISGCRSERQGIYVLCRQAIIEQSLLDAILSAVKGILSLLLSPFTRLPRMTSVSQQNCVFSENNCLPY